MAQLREIKNRIKSVESSKSITSTMDMVAQSKYTRLLTKLEGARPHYLRTMTILYNAMRSGLTKHPLFIPYTKVNRVALIVFSASRGLCGAYNADMTKLALERHAALIAEGKSVMLFVIGKKGSESFRSAGRGVERTYLDFDDKVKFTAMARIPVEIVMLFLANRIQAAEVVYSRFISRGKQAMGIAPLLPVSEHIFDDCKFDPEDLAHGVEYLYEPSSKALMDTLAPEAVHTRLFTMMLESFLSEEVARMTAMHGATDNADKLIKELHTHYNRVRQNAITTEMLEIISGGDAVKE